MALLKTTVLRLIPLLAMCAAAQATSIYEFGSSVAGACGGTGGGCTGGAVSGTTTPVNGSVPGGATLLVNPAETYTALSQGSGSGTFDLSWSGIGDGLLGPSIPIFWNFLLSPVGGTATIYWNLELILGTGINAVDLLPTTTWHSQTGAQQNIGFMNIPTGALSGTTLGAWDVVLTVAFQPTSGGNGVSVSQVGPNDPAFELGGSVPEPATWGQAGGGLLFALLMAGRKLRRR